MALVGEGFSLNVRKEINARQQVFNFGNKGRYVNSEERRGLTKDQTLALSQIRQDSNILYHQFKNNNAFARLASGVDLKVVESLTPSGSLEDYKSRLSELTSHFEVEAGATLAKKVVLSSGVSEYKNQDQGLFQKSGFNLEETDGKYPNTSYGFGGTEFGYKPMPHLNSINTSYYNNGALAKADISIKCYSPQQLEILELLYLRPGFHIFAEWGHTYYLTEEDVGGASDSINITTNSDKTDVSKPFRLFFKEKITSEQMYQAIEATRKKYRQSYEAFYGTVVNFSYTLNEDASYDVTVKAIAAGGVVESLKANKSASPSAGDATNKAKKPQCLLSLQLEKLASDFTSTSSPGNPKNGQIFLNKANFNNSKYKEVLPDPVNGNTSVFQITYRNIEITKEEVAQNLEAKPNQSEVKYIFFNGLMQVLENWHSIYGDKGDPTLRFRKEHEMFTFTGHFSANPLTCYIPFKGIIQPTNADETSIQLQTYQDWEDLANAVQGINDLDPNSADYYRPLSKSKFITDLGRVAISYNCIENAINSTMDSSGRVSILKFLQMILDDVKSALGGINNFRVMLDEETSEVYVVDEGTYVATNSTEVLQKFATYGIGGRGNLNATFLQKINFTTQISNDLAATIAIGAQANGNQLGENSTGLASYNAGLIDRHQQVKTTSKDTSEQKPETWVDRLADLFSLATSTYYGYDSGKAQGNDGVTSANISQLKTYNFDYTRWVVGLYSEEKQFIPSPTFIPFDIELEMQGISGIKLFQRFTLDDKVLPYMYKGKINFIVMGIAHKIAENKWVTTIKAKAVPTKKKTKPFKLTTRKAPANQTTASITGNYKNPPSGPSGGKRKTFVKGVPMEGWYYKGPTEKVQIVLHYTADSGKSTSEGTVKWWNTRYLKGQPNQKVPPGQHVGTHYIVDRDGTYDRCMELPEWSGHIAEGKGISKVAIGIEIQNSGYAAPRSKAVRSVGPDGKTPLPYKDTEYWEEFTDAQLKTVRKIIDEIRKKYPSIPLSYNYDDWFPKKGTLSSKAMNRTPGIYTHNSYRLAKFDVPPTPKMVAFGKSLLSEKPNPYIDPILNNIDIFRTQLYKEARRVHGDNFATLFPKEYAAAETAIRSMKSTVQGFKNRSVAEQKNLFDFIKAEFENRKGREFRSYAGYLFAARDKSLQYNKQKTPAILKPYPENNSLKFYRSPNNFDSAIENTWESYIDKYYLTSRVVNDTSIDADL